MTERPVMCRSGGRALQDGTEGGVRVRVCEENHDRPCGHVAGEGRACRIMQARKILCI